MTAREIAETVWNERGPRPGFTPFHCLEPQTQELLTSVAERALTIRASRRKRAG